ncbi:NAD-P-binding protein [Mycena albidolilacea]|uniref:NAD-P-binding protein n=1 Tax=Mycena albidolilacea TaxID=1033008 RepID=A0AAD7EYL6_9AGAR|nr:NAD-P-binding protein [Mycena albidolilacea]
MAAAVQKIFLSSSYYAVIGASKDQTKFGTKILNWYKARSLDVQPIHPKETDLEGIDTIPTVAELPHPTKTSLSIITPPKVTLSLLQAAIPLGVPAVWIQPGAADESVAAWVKENGLESRVIYGGPCILRDGDSIRSLL